MAAVNSRVNLSDTVLEKLEEMVSKKKPGDRLPTEAELSEQFSVGRSTIRESMKVLAAKRMIVRRNEGTFVADMMKGCFVDPLNMIINMSTGDLNSLIELREILELSAVQLASQRATAEDVLEMQRANWMMKEPGQGDHLHGQYPPGLGLLLRHSGGYRQKCGGRAQLWCQQ